MTAENLVAAPAGARALTAELQELAARIRLWPWPAKLFLFGVVLLYLPIVAETSRVWLHEDQHAHGLLVFPVALVLLWGVRHDLRRAIPAPTAWGLVPLMLGLGIELISYLARIKFLPMASLVLVLMGGILLLHGRTLWKHLAFIVLYLLFAAPMPDALIMPISSRIQSASTTCAAETMQSLGFSLLQTGNRIDTPNASVEVAEVCSGFKKLTVLVAFSLLYGFVLEVRPGKRFLLVLSTYPIALISNSLRIAALVGIGSIWGPQKMEAAHDPAEFGVLVLATLLFLCIGRLLGCKALRPSL